MWLGIPESAEKKNFVWTGMENDIVFPEFESLDIHYVRIRFYWKKNGLK